MASYAVDRKKIWIWPNNVFLNSADIHPLFLLSSSPSSIPTSSIPTSNRSNLPRAQGELHLVTIFSKQNKATAAPTIVFPRPHRLAEIEFCFLTTDPFFILLSYWQTSFASRLLFTLLSSWDRVLLLHDFVVLLSFCRSSFLLFVFLFILFVLLRSSFASRPLFSCRAVDRVLLLSPSYLFFVYSIYPWTQCPQQGKESYNF